GAEDGADDLQPTGEDGVELQLGAPAGDQADEQDAPAAGDAGQVLRDVAAADELEDDVGAAAGGGLEDGGREFSAVGPDGVLEAERPGPIQLVGGAGGADGGRAQRADELDRRGADAAPAGRDEDVLAGAKAGLGDERVVGGDERLGHGG